MIIHQRFSPLAGERILAVQPEPALRVEDVWQRRIRHFTGRTLTSAAFQIEQGQRLGHLNLLGQLTAPGVVEGLQTGIDRTDPTALVLEVAPGLGVAASGELVALPQPLRVAVADLGAPETGAPQAGILVIEIVENSLIPGDPRTSQCEEDQADDAFSDWQLVDGARLAFVPWPNDYIPLPAFGDAWRNRLAAAIFQRELARSPREYHPWEEVGVPVALIGLDAQRAPMFLDRSSVVRDGGRPRRRTDLLPLTGNRRLWQARLLQFAEHMGEIEAATIATAATNALAQQAVSEAARQFRFVPPAGVLPRASVDFIFSDRADTVPHSFFFPNTIELEAVPVPVEQLDVAVQASASLIPIDLASSDEAHLLVPVPAAYFEPRLLKVELIDPAFQAAIDAAVARRGEFLLRRSTVRGVASNLNERVTGKPLVFAEPDPNRLDPTEQPATALPTPEKDYAAVLTQRFNEHRTNILPHLTAVYGADAGARQLEIFVAQGLKETVRTLEALADRANDRIDLGFLRVQADIYRVRQITLGSTKASRLTTSPAAASITQGNAAVATEVKLQESFVTMAAAKIDRGSVLPFEVQFNNPVITEPLDPQEGARFTAADFTTSATSAFAGPVRRETAEVTARAARIPGLEPEKRLPVTTPPQRETPPRAAPPAATTGSSVITGKGDARTTTVTDRLDDSPALEAWQYAVSSKKDVVASFQDAEFLPLFGSVTVPGVFVSVDEANRRVNRNDRLLNQVTTANILAERLSPRAVDEGGVFRETVDILDRAISVLRAIEGRVASLRKAVQVCRDTIAKLDALNDEMAERLNVIEDELSEARQDVSIATALRNEEQLRLDTINGNRRRILTEHVPFVAFVRPRTHSALSALPVRTIDPEFTEAPVPACLNQDLDPPLELRRYIDTLKEAPVQWFPRLAALVDRLNTRERLFDAITAARRRAISVKQTQVTVTQGRFQQALFSVLAAQQQTITLHKTQVAQIDLREFERKAWKDLSIDCRRIVSVADLLEAAQGNPALLAAATRELHAMGSIGACLHRGFAEVLPAIRLDWALRFSQFDQEIPLRKLTILPRFSELEYLDRHELQGLADWLYDRVDATVPDAVSAINDFIRIALLLASHAPVTEIIAGAVAEPVRAPVGGNVKVKVDITRVHRGMDVNILRGADVVAQGVLDDIEDGVAAVQVLKHLKDDAVQIDKDTRVQFTPAGAAKQSKPAKQIESGGRSLQQELTDFFKAGKK